MCVGHMMHMKHMKFEKDFFERTAGMNAVQRMGYISFSRRLSFCAFWKWGR